MCLRNACVMPTMKYKLVIISISDHSRFQFFCIILIILAMMPCTLNIIHMFQLIPETISVIHFNGIKLIFILRLWIVIGKPDSYLNWLLNCSNFTVIITCSLSCVTVYLVIWHNLSRKYNKELPILVISKCMNVMALYIFKVHLVPKW